jgi:hypothetical protein
MRSLSICLVLFGLSAQGATTDELTALGRYEQLADRAPETLTSLDLPSRRSLFKEVTNHPVTNLDHIAKYDPDGYIGFCFGRSMGVHLMARRMGLEAESLRKLFIIGDLRSGTDPEWRFHVTTLVKGMNGLWYAVDPIMTPPVAPGGPLKMEEWVRIVRRVWDKKAEAKLYLTSAHAVMPDVTKDPHGTTGDAILEVVFDPSKKGGFKAVNVQGIDVFETDATAEATYLMSVKEPESDRFKFDSVEIAGNVIGYKGYFFELLGDLTGEAPATALTALKKERERESVSLSAPAAPSLHSPRFEGFFRRGARP